MSYFNPEVYNFEALKPEDQKLIRMYDFAVEDALNKDFIIDDMMGLMGDDSTIGKIKREVAEEVFENLREYLGMQRMEQIVSIIDNYPPEE